MTLGLLATATWNQGIGILFVVYLAITGFASAIAVLNSIQAVIKNYDKRNAILPIGLLIGVINLAELFDESVQELFFKQTSLTTYLLYAGAFTAVVYVLSSFFVRKIDITPSQLNDMKQSDKWIFFIYYLLFVLLIIFIFFGYKIAKIMSAPFWGMLAYLSFNFVVVILAVPL